MYTVKENTKNSRYWSKEFGASSFPQCFEIHKEKAHEYLGACSVKFPNIKLEVIEIEIKVINHD